MSLKIRLEIAEALKSQRNSDSEKNTLVSLEREFYILTTKELFLMKPIYQENGANLKPCSFVWASTLVSPQPVLESRSARILSDRALLLLNFTSL